MQNAATSKAWPGRRSLRGTPSEIAQLSILQSALNPDSNLVGIRLSQIPKSYQVIDLKMINGAAGED